MKSGSSVGTINKAQKQLKEVPLKLKLLFQAINGTASCEISVVTVAFFPHDNLNEDIISKIRKKNPGTEVVGKQTGVFTKQENFRQFWMDLVDISENLNLFANERFQKFIAILCCYRGAVYLNGTLNAVRVAELIQRQLLTPKMKSSKAEQLVSRREVQHGFFDSSENVLFLTDEQQEVEMCTDRLQLICGPPGTGKTLLLLLQVVRAAQDAESKGRLYVRCEQSFKRKFTTFFEVNRHKFAPGRRPIVFASTKSVNLNGCDDIFEDEWGIDDIKYLEKRINHRGRTVVVVTNNFYPKQFWISAGKCCSSKTELHDAFSAQS